MKADAGRFGLHPVLLDAVLHGIAAGGVLAESELTRLPFEWEGVSLHAVGATRLRARITLCRRRHDFHHSDGRLRGCGWSVSIRLPCGVFHRTSYA